jgi:CRP-like cAMP-binding protein
MFLINLMDDDIKKKLIRKKYNANSTILFAEEENNYVYFLIEGVAEAYIQSPQGAFATLHLYKEGSFFGEIEQFYDGRKPVEITALTDCVVEAMYRNDFLDWLHKDFEATKFIIKEISYKLIINAELIEAVLLMTVKERLLRCVAIHHYRKNLDKLTKDQLSKEVNAPIRSINRAIVECTKQGIICYKDKKISILDENIIHKHLPQY